MPYTPPFYQIVPPVPVGAGRACCLFLIFHYFNIHFCTQTLHYKIVMNAFYVLVEYLRIWCFVAGWGAQATILSKQVISILGNPAAFEYAMAA